ncbi:kelch repeat and BTB domain-containing protein 13-like [Conger conger]|uniref:kelch repeat and BTB domain-containing protein 13-like n=1 Tax=Conger conger TaxID=82655 RepID=UPI002A59C9F2|nr:kelch repeat and BTB domain-containing protein 13-like [Conger conger]
MDPSSCHGLEVEAKVEQGPLVDMQMADLRVRVEERVFAVDRTLLERGSEYFRALFRSGMRDCQQEDLDLKGLNARGFAIALDVLAGGRPTLSGDEILEAVECAVFLQVEPLTKHLVNLLNSDNCLLMYHTAAMFGLLELYNSAALFIRDMYRDLEEDLKRLPEELVEYVESLEPSVFVAVGTHSSCTSTELPHAATRTVCYLNEDKNCWKVLTELPMEVSTSMAGVAVLENKLYIVGGLCGVHKKASESFFCYDVVTNVWSALASPQQPRYNLMLVGHEDHLYMIGGEYERALMSSVERYHVSAGTWSYVSDLPRPVSGGACTKALSRIFVCLWKPMETTEIYEYLPSRDRWALVTTLIRHQSYGHCMVGHRDDLYVMRNGPSDDFLRCMMDCYSLTSGQWTPLQGHYPNSRGALFTAAVRGDSVFTVNRTATQEYTVTNKTWKQRAQLKGFPRSGSMWTFFLRLPKADTMPGRNSVIDS